MANIAIPDVFQPEVLDRMYSSRQSMMEYVMKNARQGHIQDNIDQFRPDNPRQCSSSVLSPLSPSLSYKRNSLLQAPFSATVRWEWLLNCPKTLTSSPSNSTNIQPTSPVLFISMQVSINASLSSLTIGRTRICEISKCVKRVILCSQEPWSWPTMWYSRGHGTVSNTCKTIRTTRTRSTKFTSNVQPT